MAYQTMVVRYFGMTTIMNGSPSGISSINYTHWKHSTRTVGSELVSVLFPNIPK